MTVASSIMPATVTTLPVGSQVPNASATTASTGLNGANATLNENDFLQLLTTQLEKQDPLNPVSPSDFAAELAQFSTATGVQSLNSTLGSSSGIQAASLVGHNVAVAGNALVLGQGGTATGAFSLSGAASDVKVAVTNAQGGIVGLIDLGPLAAGTQNFTWNGQAIGGGAAPAGTYSYALSVTGAGGSTVTPTPYAVVPVTAVTLGGTGSPTLNLGGGMSPVALGAVQQVY